MIDMVSASRDAVPGERKPEAPRRSRNRETQPTVKLTVNLPEPVFEILEAIAEERHTNMTEALKVAISTEEYVRRILREGGKILVERSDGSVREVEFR
jgi:hypothetical protein